MGESNPGNLVFFDVLLMSVDCLQVYQSAQNMIDEGHFAAEEIKARIGHLKDHWTQLKAKCEQRRQDLEDSLQAHQYFSG